MSCGFLLDVYSVLPSLKQNVFFKLHGNCNENHDNAIYCDIFSCYFESVKTGENWI